jgi:hypothetical protein
VLLPLYEQLFEKVTEPVVPETNDTPDAERIRQTNMGSRQDFTAELRTRGFVQIGTDPEKWSGLIPVADSDDTTSGRAHDLFPTSR